MCECLDRFIATSDLLNAYPNCHIQFEYIVASDQLFIVMDTNGDPMCQILVIHGDYFKFDNWWAFEPECREKIIECWNSLGRFTLEKLANFGTTLDSWQQQKRRKSSGHIHHLQKALNDMMAEPLSNEALHDLTEIEAKLKHLIDKDEAYWSQGSRVHWPWDGDKNAKFFHARAIRSRKENRVKGLIDSNGNWYEKLL
ncbi:hypothetical protein V6N13_130119 [Hibiscus sabdariffa]